jgi:hypothetical protein
MILTVTIIGLAIALACFVVASATTHARDTTSPGWVRTNWIAVGLAVYVLVQLILAILAR